MVKKAAPIDEYWLVDDVMRRHPATIRVFLDYRMNCVGCPIGTFHTVEDACREYGTALGSFLEDLRVHIPGSAIPVHLQPAETDGVDREP